MKTSTTIILLLLTAGLGAWMLLRGDAPRDLSGHLLFDWGNKLKERIENKQLPVDVDPALVAGIDLKVSSGEYQLRRQANGSWEVGGAVKDRVEEEVVKELLAYFVKAQIKDVVDAAEVKGGKVSATSLGLDDANVWKVTWLKADGSKMAEARIGKTAPLDNVGYVQLANEKSRPDIYIVSPDLRPLLTRPADSFRDPRASLYPSDALVKLVVRKGEGEVEFSRTIAQTNATPKTPADPAAGAGKTVVEVQATPWIITRPLQNAPANQAAVQDFAAMICGAKVESWLPYSETEAMADKPVVEVTLVPFGTIAKNITLSFFKDPADPDPLPAPGEARVPGPEDPKRYAICRDIQRKACYKVKRQVMDDLCLAESPTIFRSRVLAAVNAAIVSTIRIESFDGDSVEVVRVGTYADDSSTRMSRWYWRPLKGGPFADAAPETVEKLIMLLNETQVLEFTSDSLTDPALYGLDKPMVSVTIGAGAHVSLEKLTPLDSRNSQTLRIGWTKEGFFANFVGDSFVFKVGPELPSGIPSAAGKWRPLTLPGFSALMIKQIKQGLPGGQQLVLNFDRNSSTWTGSKGGVDVTAALDRIAVDSLAMKVGALQVVSWQEQGAETANKALEVPAVTIEVQYDTPDEKDLNAIRLATMVLELSPMAVPTAPFCYGRISGTADPFLIPRQVLTDMSAGLLKNR